MNLRQNRANVQGQSLFEVVLALGLATLIIVALVILATSAVRTTTFSKNKTQATRLAQEAAEWLRGERDKDWDAFKNNALFCSTPPYTQCLTSLSWGNCGSCSETEKIKTVFKREVSFSDVATDSLSFEVKVYWEDAQGSHEVRTTSVLTDWR